MIVLEKIEEVKFFGQLVAILDSHQDWVNRVPRCLPPKPDRGGAELIFLDAKGNYLAMGEDFSAAERIKSYPVKVYLPIRVKKFEDFATEAVNNAVDNLVNYVERKAKGNE